MTWGLFVGLFVYRHDEWG